MMDTSLGKQLAWNGLLRSLQYHLQRLKDRMWCCSSTLWLLLFLFKISQFMGMACSTWKESSGWGGFFERCIYIYIYTYPGSHPPFKWGGFQKLDDANRFGVVFTNLLKVVTLDFQVVHTVHISEKNQEPRPAIDILTRMSRYMPTCMYSPSYTSLVRSPD